MTDKQRFLLRDLRTERTRIVSQLVRFTREDSRYDPAYVQLATESCHRELERINTKIRRVEENCR